LFFSGTARETTALDTLPRSKPPEQRHRIQRVGLRLPPEFNEAPTFFTFQTEMLQLLVFSWAN
jgi:hypothetical protein